MAEFEQIKLRLGGDPSTPASTAKPVQVLNHYDRDLQGILRQFRKNYYLYWCVAGETSEWSLWVYVPLHPAERRKLRNMHGDELRQYSLTLLADRDFTYAVAHYQDGIREQAIHRIEVGESGTDQEHGLDVEQVARAGWGQIKRRIDTDQEAVSRLAFA